MTVEASEARMTAKNESCSCDYISLVKGGRDGQGLATNHVEVGWLCDGIGSIRVFRMRASPKVDLVLFDRRVLSSLISRHKVRC